MSRDYPRLSIQDFGAHLLRTEDLDPIYTALVGTGWKGRKLCRWLTAYWCFYDAGFASYVCESHEGYWETMARAAVNGPSGPAPIPGGRWPRGRERRHFRGKAGIAAVASLVKQYPRESRTMVDAVIAGAPDYKATAKLVQSHVGFGPWIGFKVADMIDRVIGVEIDFTEAAVFMFKDPVMAAIMYWNVRNGGEPSPEVPEDYQHLSLKQHIIPSVCNELITHFHDALAPPRRDRPVNLQEVETILCKWKSHVNGHYPLNNDIREIREGVKLWTPYAENAADFLAAMPEVGP